MKPYEWMVKYTPQVEWIERRGKLMWLAEVFGGIGAGLYIVALYFDSLWGMFLGWLTIVVLKGGFHLAYLGKPLRFWRILLRPQSSWLSRGFIFMGLFILFGAIQFLLSAYSPGTAAEVAFKALAAVMAFLLAMYTGFVMNFVKGIQFWNSALLPLLFVLTGILDGLALVLAIGLSGGSINVAAVETASRVLLIVAAIFIGTYFWSATYTGPAGKQSVSELMRGRIAPVLWLGVVLCGILIPAFVAAVTALARDASGSWLIIGIISEMVGAFSLKYSVLKAGIYEPLIPVSG